MNPVLPNDVVTFSKCGPIYLHKSFEMFSTVKVRRDLLNNRIIFYFNKRNGSKLCRASGASERIQICSIFPVSKKTIRAKLAKHSEFVYSADIGGV